MPDTTTELLAEHVEMVLANDHALYLERQRRCIRAAAASLATSDTDRGSRAVTAAADALRDWLRDELLPTVIDSATVSLTMQWQRARADAAAGGANVRHLDAVGWRSWGDSELHGAQLLAREIISTALDSVDWRAMADAVLCDGEPLLLNVAELLAELHELYPNENEPTGEVPAADLCTRLAINSATLAERLAVLSRLGLASDRYVGGTSGTLLAPTAR